MSSMNISWSTRKQFLGWSHNFLSSFCTIFSSVIGGLPRDWSPFLAILRKSYTLLNCSTPKARSASLQSRSNVCKQVTSWVERYIRFQFLSFMLCACSRDASRQGFFFFCDWAAVPYTQIAQMTYRMSVFVICHLFLISQELLPCSQLEHHNHSISRQGW